MIKRIMTKPSNAILVRDAIEEYYEEEDLDTSDHIINCLEYIHYHLTSLEGNHLKEKEFAIVYFIEYEELPETFAPILSRLDIDIIDILEEMLDDYKSAENEAFNDYLDLQRTMREARES